MNKVTVKVFFSTMLVIVLASAIPNLILYFRGYEYPEEFRDDRPYLLITIFSVFFLIMVFNFIMNKIVYKRMKNLNNATKEVIIGNYDVQIETGKKDEIADLIQNFNIMTQELKMNEYQNKEFVRNFSHELKTPLSAIKGYSDLILKDDISKEELKEYATIISNESSRLTELSRNMLLISLVDSKVILPKQDTYNVSEQIRNVIQLTHLSWEEKELEFELDFPDIKLTSNKELLYQVWMNLISNAIKFSPRKSTIKLNLIEKDEKHIFIIENKATITKDNIGKLFDLFFILNKSRDNQSNGIGLTLTKKIITKLGGNISVESEDDITKFIIEF